MTKVFVADLVEGQVLRSIFQIRRKDLYNFREKQGKFLSLTLGDKSGEIEAKVWDRAEEIAVSLKVNDFIAILGQVGSYNQRLQITIDKLKVLDPAKVDITQFLPSTPYDVQELWSELKAIVETVQNPYLKELVEDFLQDEKLVEAFCRAPAAKVHHQSYLGGLLEHTLNVLRLCRGIAAAYPEVDQDLLFTGALFHDIGKIYEFDYQYAIDYTDAGRLLGHIVMGVDLVHQRLRKITGFPDSLRLKLLHMIVSHHGKYEWQSPKKPKFLEAAILHQADLLDAEMDKFRRAREATPGEGNWTPYNRQLERYIFTG
ncbi:MAG: HD domain-containing protein [Clostridia bacterium]|nr:HD domain-containing protein [Clostridia bacterium]